MNIPIYQVDAFSSKLFGGNPAAICPLDHWLPDATLQSIAAENSVSETAYYVRKNGNFHIRWFTPGVEVDLCGHATLASAHVILDIRREVAGARVAFESKSGELIVTRQDDLYALDFPARPPIETKFDDKLFEALGATPTMVLGARDYLCVFDTEAEVRALRPNMERLAAIDRFATIVTAPGTDCDFVSRFFAPAKGVPEDPVTGSAHCTLIPYWAARLGKSKLFARQISPRGGELWCEHRGDRVTIAGRAVKYLEGTIVV
ncbi:MAG TPA: PhzF family phenazine biosynthesis protein [Bryobacteraceae bacterium]|nr:PhzF family phenazine biosynthesis protein [Bryobacteraceae bacterium]